MGISVHNSKPLEHGVNPKQRDDSKVKDDLNVMHLLKEENIEEDTKEDYPAIRRLLEIKFRSKGLV